MDYFTLEKFEVQAGRDNQILVLAKGSQVYKTILARAFPGHFMSRTFEDRRGRYEWGTYIYDVDSDIQLQIEHLLHAFQAYIYIEDDLTETFALDYHTAMSPTGSYYRTTAGELVYSAKPYQRKARAYNFIKAEELANLFTTFIQTHPSYAGSDIVVSVPPSNPARSFSLPTELAKYISRTMDILDGTEAVQKTRITKPMKDCTTPHEKINNVRNSFSLTRLHDIAGKNVMLIDDVYSSGFTINEVGRVLIEGGAKAVFGLVATKTSRDV